MGAIHTSNALEGKTMKVSKMEYLELSEDHRKKAEESRSEYMRKFHLEQAEFWKKLASA